MRPANAGDARVEGVERIAVIRPNAVGDFVFALPALHALKHAYPQAELVYLGRPWHAEFLAERPGPIDRVVVVPPCPGVGAPPDAVVDGQVLSRFVQAMREERFDLVLQMYGGGQYANPFALTLGGRVTAGMRADGAPALDRSVTHAPLQNRRLQLLEVAELVGATHLPLVCGLALAPRDTQEAAHVLAQDSDGPLVIVQPGATDPRRRWSPSRFAAVADTLAAQGARIAVHGTQDEAEVVAQVIGAMRAPALNLTGRLSLSGLCGLLSRAALLLSNDTGPLHLALALGTPCVGIYWLHNLVESGPLHQEGHRALLSPRVRCPVCDQENLTARCPHDDSFVDDVGLDDATRAALSLFKPR